MRAISVATPGGGGPKTHDRGLAKPLQSGAFGEKVSNNKHLTNPKHCRVGGLYVPHIHEIIYCPNIGKKRR